MSPSQGGQALCLGEVSVLSPEGSPSVIRASELLQQPIWLCDLCPPQTGNRKPQSPGKNLIMW